MGLFSSLFGSSTSDKADKFRQQAIDAFNSIKTPELSQLQVSLQNYVNAGKITPEQAEATLLNSNAFNSIKTDPSNTGAAKQALQQLQTIGTKGGVDAISQARLNDITNQQNQEAQSRNASVMQQAQARGTGGSNLNTVNQLVGEQGAANRAAQSGTQVAADAESRALQALQGAGQLGQSLEAQQYGEQANKAQAQNAIQQFNAQTQNATNLENVREANAAQAANVANAQNVANLSTQTQNQGKMLNAQAAQQQYADQLAKAQGTAGQFDQWANSAQEQKNKEQGADLGLLSGAVQGAAGAIGYGMAGPAGGAVAQKGSMQAMGGSTNPYGLYKNESELPGSFAHGGEVTPTSLNANKADKGLEDEYREFVSKYCYGGSVKMADGGMVHIKAPKPNENKADPDCADEYRPKITDYQPSEVPVNYAGGGSIEANEVAGYAQGGDIQAEKPLPIEWNQDENAWELKDKDNQRVGTFKSYDEATDFAQKVQEKAKEPQKVHDFLKGGAVPGIPKVSGDSVKNDVVPAKLSPGEVVLPRSVVARPEAIPKFVDHATHQDLATKALKRLSNPYKDLEGR